MKTNFINKNIISIKDLTKQETLYILKVAGRFKSRKNPKAVLLQGKIVALLFFEPSTRTRLSFETAALRLGAKVIGFAQAGATSTAKGEALSDSIKIVGQYADVIVMRHSKEGAARLAAQSTSLPVINAGDGANQHPTQTFLDLFTIYETQKKLNNLSIALVGDLKYSRTVHSLSQALAWFSPRLYFVAPPSLQIPDYILETLRQKQIKYSFHNDFKNIISKTDIFYMTRIQKERFPDLMEYEKVKNVYRLTSADLKKVKNNLKILHPLPRLGEIAKEIDKTPYAYYFQQAENGIYVRQAILALVLGKE